MVQQQLIIFHGWKCHQLWLGFWAISQTFPNTALQKLLACGDPDGPLGADCTSKHHSLDLYGGHEMVKQQLMSFHG
jgi:hypothetical protein